MGPVYPENGTHSARAAEYSAPEGIRSCCHGINVPYCQCKCSRYAYDNTLLIAACTFEILCICCECLWDLYLSEHVHRSSYCARSNSLPGCLPDCLFPLTVLLNSDSMGMEACMHAGSSESAINKSTGRRSTSSRHMGGPRLPTDPGSSLFCVSPRLLANPDKSPKPSDDIYSVGCVLYNMLFGCHPFEMRQTETFDEWLDRIPSQKLIWPRKGAHA